MLSLMKYEIFRALFTVKALFPSVLTGDSQGWFCFGLFAFDLFLVF